MNKHGRFSISFCISLAFASLIAFTGCAGNSSTKRVSLSPQEISERKYRRAQAKIEILKERNQILRQRLKLLTRSGAVTPLVGEANSVEPLAGFESGIVTEVPIDSRKPVALTASKSALKNVNKGETAKDLIDLRTIKPKASKEKNLDSAAKPAPKMAATLPQKVSGTANRSGRGNAANPSSLSSGRSRGRESIGEQADYALLRTLLAQLKSEDVMGAERTVRLMEKSYPDSKAYAEARFEMGLFHYRQSRQNKNKGTMQADTEAKLRAADFQFAEALNLISLDTRVKAGASLMRGVIAKLLLENGGEPRNRQVAKQNFEFVISHFPQRIEARRAKRELLAMERRAR